MSATRLLLLGLLRHRPMHGYEIRRELELWGAERWANIAYGSIYFSLGKMAQEGLVEVVEAETRGKRPARTVYAITEAGRQQFAHLLSEWWWEIKPVIDPFQVALVFMDALPKDELLLALRRRANLLRADIDATAFTIRTKVTDWGAARHIADNLRLASAHFEAELRWVEEAIEKVERDELP